MRREIALVVAFAVSLGGYSLYVGFHNDAPRSGLSVAFAGDDDDDDDDGGSFIVDVLVDASSVTGPGQPFYVGGPIYPAGTFAAEGCTPTVAAIGDYHCWGHFPPGGGPGVVSQEFDFFGFGKIECQGREGPNADLGVVGGTGDFRNAAGERLWVAQFLCPGPGPGNPGSALALTVEFDLSEED